MTRPTLDEWAFKMVTDYAERGTCGRRKAGALALDGYNRIVGLGMNGVPRGHVHCIDKPCPGRDDPPGDTRNCLAIHAEANMILNSIAPDRIITVYTSALPCLACSLLLVNLPNIRSVKAKEGYADERGLVILRRSGIKVEVPDPSGQS